MDRSSMRRSGVIGSVLAMSMLVTAATSVVHAQSGAPSSAPPTARASAGASGAPERTFDACPIDLATATAIAGRDLEPATVYDGAPVFQGETIDGATSWMCGYRLPGNPSDTAWNVHLEYSVDGSADAKWALFQDAFLNDQYVAVDDRFGVPAYERVWTDEPGGAELSLTLRGPDSYVLVGLAAYGLPDTVEGIRPIADAFATALLAAIGAPTPSSAP
ncbi:MAG: hypothetical protein U0667_16635 [Chloroflexota bacterium]